MSNNMKEDIKAYMQIKTCCTTREVAEATGISVYQAQYYLSKLQEKGEIVRSEKRRGAAVYLDHKMIHAC